MSLGNLAKQLRRDIAANPKKAAVLGLMVLVALYFWGPLLVKWSSASGSKQSAKMNPASLILTDDPAEPTQQSRARVKAKFHWDRVRQLMLQDPCMLPAKLNPAWVDPFAPAMLTTATEQPTDAAALASDAKILSEAIAPDQFAIELGGVFVGARTRVATINGEACHEGDTLAITGKSDKNLTSSLRVVQIRRQGVIVDIGGHLLTLEFATASLGQGDEIQRQKADSK